MIIRIVRITAVALILGACGQAEDPSASDATESTPNPEPVVVYASHDDKAYFPTLFAGFTAETGIRVTVKHAEPAKNVSDVVDHRGSPPADILLVPDVQSVITAADEGALRPLGSDMVRQRVPAMLRDPDDLWTAVSLRHSRILFDSRVIDGDTISGFESLAEPQFKGHLCLTTAALPLNRSLLTMLFRDHGARPAEIIVRGWVSNLALPAFESEEQLAAAVAAGTCGVGIVSSSLQLPRVDGPGTQPLMTSTPMPTSGNVQAAGIARHAREPDAARRFLEWLLSDEIQNQHAREMRVYPAVLSGDGPDSGLEGLGDTEIGAAGWYDEDVVRLAERAGYR